MNREEIHIKQGELFCGVTQNFIKEFINISERVFYNEGDFLFHLGAPANYFYILIKGCVKLSIGEKEHTVYTVTKAGEMLGWSGLIGRNVYTATAICMEPTNLLKINKEAYQKLLKKDPANALIFYKCLVKELANRLFQCYTVISCEPNDLK